jgi:hypothetical protein
VSIFVRHSESNHWYTKDGEPAYEIEAKNGELRPTTLWDARKLGLVPSVTSILKVASKPGLEIWKQTQIIQAALTLPRNPGEGEDEFSKRVIQDSQEQARKAREKGSEIHGAIEWHFKGGEVPVQFKPVIHEVEATLAELGLKGPWSPEKSFASPAGYGGKIDLHNKEAVIDFKTKKDWDDKSKLGYDEHAMQLAAYAYGLGNQGLRKINIFVSTKELGKVESVEWENTNRYWVMFTHLLNYWKLANNYLL